MIVSVLSCLYDCLVIMMIVMSCFYDDCHSLFYDDCLVWSFLVSVISHPVLSLWCLSCLYGACLYLLWLSCIYDDCLVLSLWWLSCHVLSLSWLSCLVLSSLWLSCLVWCGVVWSGLVLPCLNSSWTLVVPPFFRHRKCAFWWSVCMALYCTCMSGESSSRCFQVSVVVFMWRLSSAVFLCMLTYWI